jgi:hypothetical protein
LTTFSDRILLRWVPVSTLLAAGTSVGLTVGPHPYGYHSWPRPAIEKPLESVVQAPVPDEPLIGADSRLAIRGLPTFGLNRALPSVPARMTGTRSPVGPSHALPAAAAPPSSPRSGTSQAGGAAGHPRPAVGASRTHGPGPAITATKGDGQGRPTIAAKVNVDDAPVTAAAHSRGCDHAGATRVEVARATAVADAPTAGAAQAPTAGPAQAPAGDTTPAPEPPAPAPPAPVAPPAAAAAHAPAVAPHADDSAPSGD